MVLRSRSGGVRTQHFATSVEIDRPPETVWPYLVDWENLDRWMTEGRRFRVLGDRRDGVGVEAEATIRIMGITTTDRVRVTAWQPPSILEVAHLGRVRGSGYMELSPTEEGSLLFWRETLVPPLGLLGGIGLRLLAPVVRRTFARDLRELKRIVEAEAPRGR